MSVSLHADYYGLPLKGMDRELKLATTSGLPELLGVKPSEKVVGSLEISVTYAEQDEQYEGISQIDSEFYIPPSDDPDKDPRGDARRAILDGNPLYERARIERRAWDEDVPPNLHPAFIDYNVLRGRGKPEGWMEWWQDDRILRDNPNLFRYFRETKGWADKDFDLIPNESFELLFNTEYIKLLKPDRDDPSKQVPDAPARNRYRRGNREFEAEGIRIGMWKEKARLSRSGGSRGGGIRRRQRRR